MGVTLKRQIGDTPKVLEPPKWILIGPQAERKLAARFSRNPSMVKFIRAAHPKNIEIKATQAAEKANSKGGIGQVGGIGEVGAPTGSDGGIGKVGNNTP